MKKIETISAEKYRDTDGIYHFPFKVLDDAPGGQNLGRIQWQIEPIRGRKNKGRYFIEKLLVYASQTRAKEYRGKVFEIPCYTECITADSLGRRDSFLHHVWRVMYCEVHKALMFSAYPKDHHSVLEINVGSSISIDIDFK